MTIAWTRTAPTVEGWCWLKWGDACPELDFVFSEGDGGFVFSHANIPVTDPADAWWYGPIEPPPGCPP